MQKKRHQLTLVTLIAIPYLLFGGTGSAEDGFLAFIIILAFLGLILGLLHLVDYIKILIRRLMERKGYEKLP